MKKHNQLIEQYGALQIISTLDPFVSERRKERIDEVLSHRLDSIQLAIESPADINNALAAIRTCEALGISKIHIITPESSAKTIHSVTKGAFHWVDICFHETLTEFLKTIKESGFILAGAVIDGPETLSDVSIEKPICFFMGNEQRGLSQEARKACDILYCIPMVGMSGSLNVSVSAAISLYDASQRKRKQLSMQGDLSSEQIQRLRARYYMNSVSNRLVETTFK